MVQVHSWNLRASYTISSEHMLGSRLLYLFHDPLNVFTALGTQYRTVSMTCDPEQSQLQYFLNGAFCFDSIRHSSDPWPVWMPEMTSFAERHGRSDLLVS